MVCGKAELSASVILKAEAPLSTVWQVINDFEAIPKYNPTYVSIERLDQAGSSQSPSTKIKPNDRFRAVRQGGNEEVKVVSSIQEGAEECSIAFVESCTTTYSIIVRAIDESSCFLIGSFGASPNFLLSRCFVSLCGCCLVGMAKKMFASREMEPVVDEAGRRERENGSKKVG